MQLGIKDLLEAHRKKQPIEIQHLALARVFSRLVCILEYFNSAEFSLPFLEYLCKKYPASGCAYCLCKPCSCLSEKRENYKLLSVVLPDQKLWSISDWQNHFLEVYGKINMNFDWNTLLNRLIAEVTEISNVEMFATRGIDFSQEELIANYSKEIADTFAWTCALASKLELDLEPAVEHYYGSSCMACKRCPCNCQSHKLEFVDWEKFASSFEPPQKLVRVMVLD